jgi:CheY-like chemotaxis protein
MAPEILERAFDPFFTTKDVGEGTGLGLSMVLGFVEQSGGFVEIDSEVGQGTRVTIHLPRAEGRAASQLRDEIESVPAPGLGRTILVVEDDPDVRDLVVKLLSDLGCVTVEAQDGPSAMAIMDERSDIDVLFTDVVLPGDMSGPDIAREARRHHPDLKVVLTSGYPDRGTDDPASDDEKTLFIRKPYRKSELAEILGTILKP